MWSMQLPLKKNMHGVVVIVALFIMTIVAAIAIAMMARLQRDTLRASMIVNAAQAQLYAQGSVDWAQDALRSNWEKKQAGKRVDVLPLTSPVHEVRGYRIVSTIEDAQGRFNVNSMMADKVNAQKAFRKLLFAVEPKLSNQVADSITAGVSDWVTNQSQESIFDKAYLQAKPPYRAAHNLMGDVSELRLIKGMTPSLYNALLPHVIAFPTASTVNVQYATIPVLMSLFPSLTMESALAITNYRSATPFVTDNDFINSPIVKNNSLVNNADISVTSVYFLVTTEVSTGDQKLLLYTLLYREPKNNQATVNIIWQSRGTL